MKKNVAIIFGGCSSEYSVSLESASGVINNINRKKFNPILIGITKAGDWFHYIGNAEQIADDTWAKEKSRPCCILPNRSEHELLVYGENSIEKIHLDVVLPILHGRNGEDGTVQGVCELAQIPLAGCGVLASALCMDKDRAHKLVAQAGICVPKSFELSENYNMEHVIWQATKLGFPLFVKPVKAGSSYGIAKIMHESELEAAIHNAFRYDNRVIVEENINGFEVGCAVIGGDHLYLGEIDEIELLNGFFDFTEKYNLTTSKIHVPARVSPEKTMEIKQAAQVVYHTLGCSGFARVDLFLTPEGKIVFNEVNTIPGFTPHSRFPSMMRAVGMSFENVLTHILEEALSK